MITLIGVGHVFDIREQVREAILERNPSVVCIELDKARFEALMHGGSREGVPPMYQILAFFQKRIAKKYGVDVGDEMIAAAHSAKEIGADLAFIDLDSSQVFSQIWKTMSFEEKVKLALAAIAGIFVRKERVEKELERFQTDNEKYLQSFGQEFPSVKKVLIDDRDRHMALTLRELSGRYENILAIVGDGHIEGLRKMLEGLPLEIIRLKDLRSRERGDATFTYSYEIKP